MVGRGQEGGQGLVALEEQEHEGHEQGGEDRVQRRAQALVWLAVTISVGAVWFAASPSAWQRVTSFNDGGNGRTELWHVAWEITKDHPVNGVGLNNYTIQAPLYVRKPGALRSVALIADKPHVVHNTYLQMLAEAGVIGLVLMLVLARIDYSRFREWRIGIYASMLGLILLVLGVSTATRGSKRWLPLPGFQLEPSELGKVLLVLALSGFMVDRMRRLGDRETTSRIMLDQATASS